MPCVSSVLTTYTSMLFIKTSSAAQAQIRTRKSHQGKPGINTQQASASSPPLFCVAFRLHPVIRPVLRYVPGELEEAFRRQRNHL